MHNRWNEADAGRCSGELDACVYASRLLGAEPALVLYGGGNTSVKLRAGSEDLLYVKGSGADLAHVEPHDFTAVRLKAVQRLIDAGEMSNEQLAQAVSAHVVGGGTRPSIETLLHACLPHRFVLHTHADSILALTNTEHGEHIAAEVFGELAPRVPFRESGFALAQAAYEVYREQASAHAIGLVLLHHGVFSYGGSAREAYDNMLKLVELAEQFLTSRRAWQLPARSPAHGWSNVEIAELRCTVSHAAGFPLVLQLQDTNEFWAFAQNPDAALWWEQGPATPQHAVFVKRTPLFGRDAAHYVQQYRHEVAQHRPETTVQALGLDPAPRVIVDSQLGVWTAGVNAHYAAMTAEIFRHDVEIISRASGHDRYAGLPRSAILDAEIHYGGFEAKVRAQYDQDSCLLGEVALLACEPDIGAIGRVLADRGAEVASVRERTAEEATLDLHPADDVATTLVRELIRTVGGLDMLILSPGCEAWLPECVPLLQRSPRGGRLVLVGPVRWSARIQAGLVSRATLSINAIDPKAVTPEELTKAIARLCGPKNHMPAPA